MIFCRLHLRELCYNNTPKGKILENPQPYINMGVLTRLNKGGFYEFEKDFFSNAIFEGKTIPCISLKGQKIFHSGYELRDKDKQDIAVLESISK